MNRGSNSHWAQLIVEELTRCGCRYFVISPGSRSTPLVVAAARHPRVTTRVCIEERGAGFHAVGYARATGTPAVLVCTSGTALANYLPAVVEAAQDQVPVLVLSADRPPELHDAGANQTILQRGMLNRYARWSAELPVPTPRIDPRVVLTTIDQAVFRTTADPAGPVHVNVLFAEPLEPQPPPRATAERRRRAALAGRRRTAHHLPHRAGPDRHRRTDVDRRAEHARAPGRRRSAPRRRRRSRGLGATPRLAPARRRDRRRPRHAGSPAPAAEREGTRHPASRHRAALRLARRCQALPDAAGRRGAASRPDRTGAAPHRSQPLGGATRHGGPGTGGPVAARRVSAAEGIRVRDARRIRRYTRSHGGKGHNGSASRTLRLRAGSGAPHGRGGRGTASHRLVRRQQHADPRPRQLRDAAAGRSGRRRQPRRQRHRRRRRQCGRVRRRPGPAGRRPARRPVPWCTICPP